VIAQIKLAWWRDRLAEDPVNWPEGEPLLALLQHWPGDTRVLGAMVDGWEALLEEDFGKRIWTVFAEGRARAWTALADGLGVSQPLRPIALAVREWALLDLAAHLGDGDEQAQLRQALAREPWARPRLDRCLRPLAVLHALAQRALHRESAELLDGPGALVLAMRVGIIGR
jgi:phytoene synthase